MELSLLVVFWYGVLHAFGPDHLTAIADFSIGKDRKKSIMITVAFALGHGLMLFVFAKILQNVHISQDILQYADKISALVIMSIGGYLLYMVATSQIALRKHIHNGKEHIHIYFGKSHEHDKSDVLSSLSIGILMGIGGVRGMLITLGIVNQGSVDFSMVWAFALGVVLVFMIFGLFILYINQNFLGNITNVRRSFVTAGIISLVVGINILIG